MLVQISITLEIHCRFEYLEILSYCVCLQVLTAYVKSIEDHGYILHFGLPSFTGFLPRNNLAGMMTNL